MIVQLELLDSMHTHTRTPLGFAQATFNPGIALLLNAQGGILNISFL